MLFVQLFRFVYELAVDVKLVLSISNCLLCDSFCSSKYFCLFSEIHNRAPCFLRFITNKYSSILCPYGPN